MASRALESIERFLLPAELKLQRVKTLSRSITEYYLEKQSPFEVCPKCATPSKSTYDRRWVSIRDEPIRGKNVVLKIRKRRLWCEPCGTPFTEPVQGVSKNGRFTVRFKRSIANACRDFSSLSSVQKKCESPADPSTRPSMAT